MIAVNANATAPRWASRPGSPSGNAFNRIPPSQVPPTVAMGVQPLHTNPAFSSLPFRSSTFSTMGATTISCASSRPTVGCTALGEAVTVAVAVTVAGAGVTVTGAAGGAPHPVAASDSNATHPMPCLMARPFRRGTLLGSANRSPRVSPPHEVAPSSQVAFGSSPRGLCPFPPARRSIIGPLRRPLRSRKTAPDWRVPVGGGLCLVELRGFEPLASSMPWKRATNCAIAPGRLAATRRTLAHFV